MVIIKDILHKELVKFLGLYYLNYEKKRGGNPTLLHNTLGYTSASDYYGEYLTECVMGYIQPKVREALGRDVRSSFSYLRIYHKGDKLEKHTDRWSSEYTVSLNLLQSEPWDFFIDGEVIKQEPGDCVLYEGEKTPHWRLPFKGEYYIQCLMSYVFVNYLHVDDQIFEPRKGRFFHRLE